MRVKEDGDLDLTTHREESSRLPAVLATGVGVVLIGFGILGDKVWDWDPLWTTLLVDVGVAVGLLAALVELERRLVRRVLEPVEALQCTLATPPAKVTMAGPYLADDDGRGGGNLYMCDHDPPHAWDVLGSRVR